MRSLCPPFSPRARLKALRHPNIVTLFGLVLNPPKGVLVMELCEGEQAVLAFFLLSSPFICCGVYAGVGWAVVGVV